LRAERVDAVVVMHADGDERGERHGRTADDLLVLYAEIAEAQLFRGSFFGVALNRRFGGILLGFGMLQTEQLVDGNGVELREFDELAKLRLRGAALPFGDGLTRNAELLRQLLLRHTARAAQFVELFI
jgi:hypothetical protein